MIKATVRNNISFPSLILTKELKTIARDIIIPDMQSRIQKQIQVDNLGYPALDKKTLDKKRGVITKRIFTKSGKLRESASKKIEKVGVAGYSAKTLIETGKLFRSFIYKAIGTSTLIITLMGDRNQIGKYLQVDGIGRAKKKFLFFGISLEAERKAIDLIINKIKEKINARR
jgi:hypothetical protein